jgi:hypothetical protein
MEMARHVARVDERDGGDGFYVGKTEEERTIGRTWRRWESNFKKDLHEIERFGMSWIYVAQDKDKWQAFIDTVMNLQVPQISGICLANWGIIFWCMILLHGVSRLICYVVRFSSHFTENALHFPIENKLPNSV